MDIKDIRRREGKKKTRIKEEGKGEQLEEDRWTNIKVENIVESKHKEVGMERKGYERRGKERM